MDRKLYDKARDLVDQDRVMIENETDKAIYLEVRGENDTYKVRIERNHTFNCTCPFATLQGIPKGALCSHSLASLIHVAEGAQAPETPVDDGPGA